MRAAVADYPTGTPIRSREELRAWLFTSVAEERPDRVRVATFTVSAAGVLHLAPRRSEHVACAGGADVSAAGEIGFDEAGDVVEVTNQSTGYCPPVTCWSAVAAAFSAAGLCHPPGWTTAVVFRRCEACGQRNVVRDGWFACMICGASLPAGWNFGRPVCDAVHSLTQ